MNPMFLSYLQSMQTKSQNAQNPGLWVNGRRMPMQEGKGGADKEMMVGGIGGNSINLDGLAAQGRGAGARSINPTTQQIWNANSGNRNPARVNVENLYREDARMNPNGSPNIYNPLTNVADAEIELMVRQIARGNLGGGRAPGAMQPEPMQEDANDTQKFTKVIDTPEDKARREEEHRQSLEFRNKRFQTLKAYVEKNGKKGLIDSRPYLAPKQTNPNDQFPDFTKSRDDIIDILPDSGSYYAGKYQ